VRRERKNGKTRVGCGKRSVGTASARRSRALLLGSEPPRHEHRRNRGAALDDRVRPRRHLHREQLLEDDDLVLEPVRVTESGLQALPEIG